MKLTVGGQLNDDPANGDVERAVDGKPHEAGWRIHLKSNGDDYIEAVADAKGGYRLSFVERGERFNSEGAVDAETLKTVLVEYLNDDADWRGECAFVAESPKGHSAKAGARISSEPPPWAIILVAGAFFGAPLLFVLPESWHASSFAIVWLVAGPMVVMGLAMLANKLLLARRTAAWPQAAGRITKSEVAAIHPQTSGGVTDVINVPAVEYEFAAKGQKFTGTRISIGEDTGGANTEATLAHYPVGAAVMVYYDPADPGNCVLERDIPKAVPLGCAAIVAILAAVGFGGYWLVVHYWSFVEAYVEQGHGVVIFAGIAGLVSLMLFEGSRFGSKAGSRWPTVRGKVVESGTESYRARVNKSTVTSYAPVVEYSYLVNGHEYHSRQIKLDDDGGGDSRAEAAEIAARYPKDSGVDVHYDPTSPGNAALEKPTGTAWYLLGVAGVCFAVAIYASGFFG
jgi:hypothetical protein